MIFRINNEELSVLNETESYTFPKYTSQLINWANQNAQGTRPRVVGQLSDLFPEYERQASDISINDWAEWYKEKYPTAIEDATNKIYVQIENLKEAIRLIDYDMIRDWVEDLVLVKTFNGLYFQKAILAKLAKIANCNYRLATPDEESVGIDGFVGEIPYSIKPDTYKTMERLSEEINVRMIYYTKSKTGLVVEVDE